MLKRESGGPWEDIEIDSESVEENTILSFARANPTGEKVNVSFPWRCIFRSQRLCMIELHQTCRSCTSSVYYT